MSNIGNNRIPLTLTIDLEWYYNGDKYGNVNKFSELTLSQRFAYDAGQVSRSADAILNILRSHDALATFMAVAELDECYGDVLQRIQEAGHEIGVHSFRHECSIDEAELRKDLVACQPFQAKYRAVSFRAPRITGVDDDWFFQTLVEFGYQIDSSLYGTTPFVRNGINVVPVAALPLVSNEVKRLGNLKTCISQGALPFGSGMLASMGSYAYTKCVEKYYERYQHPACVYLHSWQVQQPLYPFRFLARHPYMYLYSRECNDLLEMLCSRYSIVPMRECLK